jgi:hypothetical protein
MKPTQQSTSGTSFHGNTILASLNELTKLLGSPHQTNPPYDKVQHEWNLETNEGEVYTVYDWKEYRHYDQTQSVEWHIGSHTKHVAEKGQKELSEHLQKQRENTLPVEKPKTLIPAKEETLCDGDYILTEGAAWFTAGEFAVRVLQTEDGIRTDIYQNGKEMENPLCSAQAFISELDTN